MTHLNGSPLGYTVTMPLSIPADCFSPQGLAVLLVTGGSYGGCWVMNALPIDMNNEPGDPCGTIETADAPRQPDRALSAARAWFEDYCTNTPFMLVRFQSINQRYGPDEAPFFSSAQVAVGLPMR